MYQIYICSITDTRIQNDKLGLLVDMDKYIRKEELNEYIDEYVEEGRINSKDEFKLSQL